jgi:Zn ribbon nucleic-acid-binding protein
MLIVVVLFATVLLRAGIVMTVVFLMLPKSFSCPRCADKLATIRHPMLRWLLPQVEHRWCLSCGWSGVVRRVRRERPLPQSRVINRAARS